MRQLSYTVADNTGTRQRAIRRVPFRPGKLVWSEAEAESRQKYDGPCGVAAIPKSKLKPGRRSVPQ